MQKPKGKARRAPGSGPDRDMRRHRDALATAPSLGCGVVDALHCASCRRVTVRLFSTSCGRARGDITPPVPCHPSTAARISTANHRPKVPGRHQAACCRLRVTCDDMPAVASQPRKPEVRSSSDAHAPEQQQHRHRNDSHARPTPPGLLAADAVKCSCSSRVRAQTDCTTSGSSSGLGIEGGVSESPVSYSGGSSVLGSRSMSSGSAGRAVLVTTGSAFSAQTRTVFSSCAQRQARTSP